MAWNAFSHLYVRHFLLLSPETRKDISEKDLWASAHIITFSLVAQHHLGTCLQVSAASDASLSHALGKCSRVIARFSPEPSSSCRGWSWATEQKVPGLSSNVRVLCRLWNSEGLQRLVC